MAGRPLPRVLSTSRKGEKSKPQTAPKGLSRRLRQVTEPISTAALRQPPIEGPTEKQQRSRDNGKSKTGRASAMIESLSAAFSWGEQATQARAPQRQGASVRLPLLSAVVFLDIIPCLRQPVHSAAALASSHCCSLFFTRSMPDERRKQPGLSQSQRSVRRTPKRTPLSPGSESSQCISRRVAK